jgi:hypothetical protein
MKITKKIKKEIEVDCIVDVLCNKCGESCVPKFLRGQYAKDGERATNADAHGLIEQTVRGHYHSENLDDMTSYTFSMCEQCLVLMFSTFKIPVVERELNVDSHDRFFG